jgi:hypothetical protein
MAMLRNFDILITRVQLFQKPEHTDNTAFTCYKNLLCRGMYQEKEVNLTPKRKLSVNVTGPYLAKTSDFKTMVPPCYLNQKDNSATFVLLCLHFAAISSRPGTDLQSKTHSAVLT